MAVRKVAGASLAGRQRRHTEYSAQSSAAGRVAGEAALHGNGELGQISWRGPQAGRSLLRVDVPRTVDGLAIDPRLVELAIQQQPCASGIGSVDQ